MLQNNLRALSNLHYSLKKKAISKNEMAFLDYMILNYLLEIFNFLTAVPFSVSIRTI